MSSCPSCSREVAPDSRFCSWCAAPLDASSTETRLLVATTPPPSAPRLTSSSGVDEGRFLPGTVIAGRYRVIGLLGRGGMGEVFRATDLTLGQPVALKFLPASLARDERSLARFYNEVRIARQITHPNVCRVYDIGEIDGVQFISMEYVDGEDLASLLRRIGRLPVDKALDAARQLCAGLAAAHEKGVLHRDLKPGNVMIDGRGKVIVMDFGLAGLSDQLQGDLLSGTPAYMSPEQLAGIEVTFKSDIYALGLVLYELFTGRRAFNASSLMELMQMQERARPASLTSVVKELDPVVERVVLRCLNPDPRQRPATALAVAAALPGGDPLAAALAAGETPSPDLVAAAGETEGLAPKLAAAWLAAAAVLVATVAILGARWSITEKVPIDVPPEALARDARVLLKNLGYTSKPADIAYGLEYNESYFDYLKRNPAIAAARWANPGGGQPPVIDFWYRESPRDLVAQRHFNTNTRYNDPPLEISGMVQLKTDPQGKLYALEAVPPQVEAPATQVAPMDWTALFTAAGLDGARFQPSEPRWTPLANWDARAAWTGDDPRTGGKLRVEAASWRSRPVSFRILGAWSSADRMMQSGGGRAQQIISLAVVYLALAAAIVIARLNVRTDKGDRRGAARLGLLYLICMIVERMLLSHHTAGIDELNIFWKSVGAAAINAGATWVFYLALEPWVRRRWPHTLISWSRFVTQGPRDPLVGRDLLYGIAFGALWAAGQLAQVRLHAESLLSDITELLSIRTAVAAVLEAFTGTLITALMFYFVLFLLRVVLRKPWIAALGFIAIHTAINTAGSSHPWVDWPTNAFFAAIYAVVLLRFGLLALIVAEATQQVLLALPRTLDFSLWYSGLGIFPLALVAIAAVYAFRTALGGRRLLREDLF